MGNENRTILDRLGDRRGPVSLDVHTTSSLRTPGLGPVPAASDPTPEGS
jgi:hypothetical protein